MRCKRICRELLWLARFGEFGPSSAPHLDHLAQCGHCRDEVGFDRALVQQLRVALAERVAEAAPSPGAWGAILERAQAPERGLFGFLHGSAGALAARLRTATAVTAMALAGIIASSTHVAITHPEAGSAETEIVTSAAGEQFERQPLLLRPQAPTRTPVMYVAAVAPSDPEAAFLISASLTGGGSVDDGGVTPPVEDDGAAPLDEGSGIEATISLGGMSGATPLDPVTADRPAPPERDPTPVEVDAGQPF
jgi:hypothetical protein